MRFPHAEHALALFATFAVTELPSARAAHSSAPTRSPIRSIRVSTIDATLRARGVVFDEHFSDVQALAHRIETVTHHRVVVTARHSVRSRVRARFVPDSNELHEALLGITYSSYLDVVPAHGGNGALRLEDATCCFCSEGPFDPTEEVTTELVRLHALQAEHAAEMIAPFKSYNGGIIPITATQTLAITDSATNAEHLAALVEALDDSERIRLNAPRIAPP